MSAKHDQDDEQAEARVPMTEEEARYAWLRSMPSYDLGLSTGHRQGWRAAVAAMQASLEKLK